MIKKFSRLKIILEREGIAEAGKTFFREIWGTGRYRVLKHLSSKRFHVRKIEGSWMSLDIEDTGISRDLLIRGHRERMETQMMKQILQPGMQVIDIGANIGYYALLESRMVTEQGSVFALEPESRNYELLCRNVELNPVKNIRTYNVGISDHSGIEKLFLSKDRNLHNLLMPIRSDDSGSVTEIEVMSLDEFIEKEKIATGDIDLIRMDIEGYEAKVLSGMENILRSAVKLYLFIEFHPNNMKRIEGFSFAKTLEQLESAGFMFRFVVATESSGKSFEFHNISIQRFLSKNDISHDHIVSTVLCKNP